MKYSRGACRSTTHYQNPKSIDLKMQKSTQNLKYDDNHNYFQSDQMTTGTKVAAQKQVIVYMGKDLSYLDARELVKEKGGLPSNVLHDDILVRSEDWRQLNAQSYYAAWAREILVYPQKGDEFKKGIDLVDSAKDDKGREWIFPAYSMPEIAIGRKGVGLFVDPQEMEVNDKRVVVLVRPESIVVLDSFIQNNGEMGRVHEATRIPLYVDKALRDQLTEEEKRRLYRIDGACVRPLVRYYDAGFYDRRGVDAGYRHDYGFGVGWVSLAHAEQPGQSSGRAHAVAQAQNWCTTLRSDAEAVELVLPGLAQHMETSTFERLARLVRTAKAQK